MTDHSTKKPRTPAEWLALGDELGVELAKVFTPEPWGHDWFDNLHLPRCIKCQCDDTKGHPDHCPAPDRIDIKDWNVAMAWRDKIRKGTDEYNFTKALKEIQKQLYPDLRFEYWLKFRVLCRDYLRAAAMAQQTKME